MNTRVLFTVFALLVFVQASESFAMGRKLGRQRYNRDELQGFALDHPEVKFATAIQNGDLDTYFKMVKKDPSLANQPSHDAEYLRCIYKYPGNVKKVRGFIKHKGGIGRHATYEITPCHDRLSFPLDRAMNRLGAETGEEGERDRYREPKPTKSSIADTVPFSKAALEALQRREAIAKDLMSRKALVQIMTSEIDHSHREVPVCLPKRYLEELLYLKLQTRSKDLSVIKEYLNYVFPKFRADITVPDWRINAKGDRYEEYQRSCKDIDLGMTFFVLTADQFDGSLLPAWKPIIKRIVAMKDSVAKTFGQKPFCLADSHYFTSGPSSISDWNDGAVDEEIFQNWMTVASWFLDDENGQSTDECRKEFLAKFDRTRKFDVVEKFLAELPKP